MDNRLKTVKDVRDGIIYFVGGGELVAYANHIQIGAGVELSPDLKVGLPNKVMDNFIVGDNSRIYSGIIAPRNFKCGDYVTIHEGVWCYGRSYVEIGHNAWFGMRCTLDAEGTFQVGNGFGAGQDTHLWSHIRHGDTLMGCRYLSFSHFKAADDVWFVGRCTSAPAVHQQFSVALVGSNVTKNMSRNSVWGGNPAVDLTEKIGAPYQFLDDEERQDRFDRLALRFWRENQDTHMGDVDEVFSRFNVEKRRYSKQGDPLEVRIMRFLLPEAKFTPWRD